GKAVGSDEADGRAGGLLDLLFGSERQMLDSEGALESDLVDVEVSPQQRDRVSLLRFVNEALDHPGGRDPQELHDVLDRALARSRDVFHPYRRLLLPGALAAARLRLLDVGAVAAGGAAHDGLLAGVGEAHVRL